MEITKVFTKYDDPYQEIIVPFFGEIEASCLDEDTLLTFPKIAIQVKKLHPIKKVKGLEGVEFITYGEGD